MNKETVTNISGFWKVHTANLINEILKNQGASMLLAPLQITRAILVQIAVRARELNDTELIKLCTRLTLYEFSDPSSAEYDAKLVDEILID